MESAAHNKDSKTKKDISQTKKHNNNHNHLKKLKITHSPLNRILGSINSKGDSPLLEV